MPATRHDADRAQALGEGGGTEFANTYAAYENLPAHERKRYDGLRVVHSFEAAQRKVNPDPSEEELAELAQWCPATRARWSGSAATGGARW